MQKSARFAGSGYSLIEALVVVVVLAILLTASLPSFGPTATRAHLRGAADHLRGDLLEARSAALQRGAAVYLVFWRSTDGRAWCWGLHTQADCDCRLSASAPGNVCRLAADTPAQTTSSSDYRGISLDALPFGGALRLSAVRADLVAGNVSFSVAPSGPMAKVVVSALGRVRLCSPAGARALGGMAAC